MGVGPGSAATDVFGQAQWQSVPLRPGKSSNAERFPNANFLRSSLVPMVSNASHRCDAMKLNMLNKVPGKIAVYWQFGNLTKS